MDTLPTAALHNYRTLLRAARCFPILSPLRNRERLRSRNRSRLGDAGTIQIAAFLQINCLSGSAVALNGSAGFIPTSRPSPSGSERGKVHVIHKNQQLPGGTPRAPN
jgi:hypothetical protein